MIGWIASRHGSLEGGFTSSPGRRGKCAREDDSAERATGRDVLLVGLSPDQVEFVGRLHAF
jgi:hypothetical protein